MSAPRYKRVAEALDDHSPPSRFTPESSRDGEDDDDSGDDEAEVHDFDRLEEQDGYELQSLGGRGRQSSGTSKAGVTQDDEDEDEDEDDNGDDAPLAGGARRRRGSAQSFELYTPDEEREVRRKLDTRLVLFVALLYLMSFLDRSNIGNAKLAGLAQDLSLSDDQFEWLLTVFYIAYVLFEWMTLCYKIFPPHIYISCCVASWGVIASLQALTNSFAFLLVLRAFLGIAEAAFVGMPFYLSFFFKREELAFRTGIFIAAAPLATSFASSLAYAIVRFGDVTGIASWRLLFLLEGFPACLVAVWTWVWLPDGPSTARWLTARQRRIASLRMRKQSPETVDEFPKSTALGSVPRHKRKFQWTEVTRTLSDPKTYATAGMFFCCNVAFSSMPVFLPTIISQMGYSELASQGLSAPPFLLAFVVVLITASVSDHIKSRSMPMVFHALLAMCGYIFLAIAGSFQFGHTLRYLAVFPICAGFFSAVTVVITWTVNNQASDEGKGTGMAVLNVIGQMGPLLGTRLYPDSEAPYYVKGMSICAAALAVVAILALVLRVVLLRENAKRLAQGNVSNGRSERFLYFI